MSGLPFPPPALDDTLGALLLGAFIGVMMYGLTCNQTFHYLKTYQNDLGIMKATVSILFLFDTTHTVLCIHLCYYYLVSNYFKPVTLLDGVWSIQVLIPVSMVVILTAQMFYVRRVYILGAGIIYLLVVIAACVLMLGTVGFGVAATVVTIQKRSFASWSPYTWLITSGYALAVATDTLLTSTLIIYLRRRSRTGFNTTKARLHVLIVYTINTGLLTSTLATLCLVFSLAQPQNLIYTALNMPTVKSYTLSVLAVLNSRQAIANAGTNVSTGDHFGTFGLGAVQPARKPVGDGEQWTNVSRSARTVPVNLEARRDAGLGDSHVDEYSFSMAKIEHV